MRGDEILKTLLDELNGEQKELAEIIGTEAYIKLVEAYGGSTVYVAKNDKIKRVKRDIEIRRKFDGKNFHSLAAEYKLSEKTIRNILDSKKLK